MLHRYHTGFVFLGRILQKKLAQNSSVLLLGESSQDFAPFFLEKYSSFLVKDTTLPFDASLKYDAILLLDTLSKVQNPRELVERCYAVLNEGGFLCVSVPNTQSFAKQIKKEDWFAKDTCYIHLYDPFKWKALFDTNSFVIETLFSDGYIHFPSMKWLFSLQSFFLQSLPLKGDMNYYVLKKSKEGCRRNPDFA